METTQAEQKKAKGISKNEDSLRDLWDSIKHTNIHIIGVPEGEQRKKGAENFFEEIAENFPNLGRKTDIQVQEAYRVPSKINPKRSTPRHILIKMAKIKDKERILKAAREMQLAIHNETFKKLSAGFSTETLQARREWYNIFKMKGKNLKPTWQAYHSDLKKI